MHTRTRRPAWTRARALKPDRDHEHAHLAGAGGVAALYHKLRDDAMKHGVVIVALPESHAPAQRASAARGHAHQLRFHPLHSDKTAPLVGRRSGERAGE